MHDALLPTAISILSLIAVIYLGALIREWRRFDIRLARLHGHLTGEGPFVEHAYRESQNRPKKASEEDADALWAEWTHSLLEPRAHNSTYRTVHADEVFTPEALIPGLTKHRGLGAAPGIFTGLGVFFTFIGLAAGFSGIEISSDATDANSIIESTSQLVTAAGAAFWASIVGVGLSLAFNFSEKLAEQVAVNRITAFHSQVEREFRPLVPEEHLLKISDLQRQSTDALNELHEKIGSRLQEVMEAQTTTIREQLSASLSDALLPAMDKLVNATTTQSSTVFEALIERFASSFADLGAQQRSAMDDSANRLQTAIDGLGAQITSVSDELRTQSAELTQRQQEVLDALGQSSEALQVSTQNLESTAGSLHEISGRFDEASQALAENLSSATGTLGTVFSRLEEQAQHGSELTAHASKLADQISGSSMDFLDASTTMSAELTRFASVQDTFHTNLAVNAKDVADTLTSYVERLSQQIATWLGTYSADVEQQIVDRMGTWNDVSQDYASQMLAIAQSLHDTVDALSRQQSPSIEIAAQ